MASGGVTRSLSSSGFAADDGQGLRAAGRSREVTSSKLARSGARRSLGRVGGGPMFF